MTSSIAPAAAAPAALPANTLYSPFVRTWLGVDLGLCVMSGLLALATTVQLARGSLNGADAQLLVIGQCAVQYTVAVFGIAGNLLLQRQRRVGFWLACVALSAVCVGMVLSMHQLRLHVADAQDDGLAVGLGLGYLVAVGTRYLLNMIYAFALRDAWRALNPQEEA